jgi:hypothetical protein
MGDLSMTFEEIIEKLRLYKGQFQLLPFSLMIRHKTRTKFYRELGGSLSMCPLHCYAEDTLGRSIYDIDWVYYGKAFPGSSSLDISRVMFAADNSRHQDRKLLEDTLL